MSTRILSKISLYVRSTWRYLLKRPAVVTSLGGIIVAMVTLVVALGWSLEGWLSTLLWGLGPLLVTAAIGMSCLGRVPQVILMATVPAYLAWFFLMGQQEWGLVIVAPVSLPILIPVWIVVAIIDGSVQNRANKSE